jgi:uncharacterized protein with HEPN domain
MPRSLQMYLWDIQQAIEDVIQFTNGRTLAEYEQDSMLRAAVERKFSVIGEALAQMTRHFPETPQKIEHARKIVDFRNLLMHGYSKVDDVVVWGVIEASLVPLRNEILTWKQEIDSAQATPKTPA